VRHLRQQRECPGAPGVAEGARRPVQDRPQPLKLDRVCEWNGVLS
jgi:hypothetical protein